MPMDVSADSHSPVREPITSGHPARTSTSGLQRTHPSAIGTSSATELAQERLQQGERM